MDIQNNISNNIKKYRKSLGLSQEALADELGITSQAVSKWECMQSIPDIEMMVTISAFFGISLDKLILDKDPEVIVKEVAVEKEMAEEDTDNDKSEEHYDRRGFFNKIYFDALPDDGDLRILQFKGRRLLREDDYDPKVRIPLSINNNLIPLKTVNVHIIGSADIKGDVSGSINAGDGVNCGNVGISVNAGDGVNCGNVGTSVNAGDGVNCGNVGVSVKAGDSVCCGNVGGSVNAGDSVTCGDVNGSVSAGDDIVCEDVNTISQCEGDIHCKSIKGTVKKCSGIVYVE